MNELILEELREAEKLQFDIFMGETTEEEAKKRFRIESTEQANWAFRKLRAINVKSNEIKELAAAERQRIDEWEKKELSVLENSTEFFEGLLAEYFIKQRELDPKFKLSTPYGRVSSRKQQPKWNYEDEKVLNWLKENDTELIRIKEEINKVELKKKYQIVGNEVVTEDGEIVEGITIENRPDSINIKVVE